VNAGWEWENARWLHLLWAVAGLAAVGVYGLWQRRRALCTFASERLLPVLTPALDWRRLVIRVGLAALCLAAIVFALADPRTGLAARQVLRRNIDVMAVLDVSRSMLARDIAPNRLERAKLSIRDDLLPALGGDRVGLIAFAGAAVLKCPLTTDYGFFRLALDEVDTDTVPRGGTLIGDALRKAGDCFNSPIDTNKLIILITDGEDHESLPVAAAEGLWKDHQIPVVAVALGDEREGARIPVESTGGEKYLEYKGQTVWSKADFDELRRVAAVSSFNAFFPVGTRDFDLGAVYRRVLPLIQFKEQAEKQTMQHESWYQPLALGALALLLIDSCPREGPRRNGLRRGARHAAHVAASGPHELARGGNLNPLPLREGAGGGLVDANHPPVVPPRRGDGAPRKEAAA
jgi:Ca-activated chloride channel homolog